MKPSPTRDTGAAGMDRDPLLDAAGVVRLTASAAEVARSHVAELDGLCAGCQADHGRLAWHPCPRAQWARSVLRRYGDPAP